MKEKSSDYITFITLTSAANDDPELANRILAITRLPVIERKEKFSQPVKDCKAPFAPSDFIKTPILPGDDLIADKVSEFLK